MFLYIEALMLGFKASCHAFLVILNSSNPQSNIASCQNEK